MTEPRIVIHRGHRSMAHAFDPSGRRLASLGQDEGVGITVEWWDVTTGDQLASVPIGEDHATRCTLDFDASGEHLVVGCGDVFVLSARTGGVVSRWSHHPESTASPPWSSRESAAAISRDGRWVASGGREKIRVRDRATGTQLHEINAFTFASDSASIRGLAFSPDGAQLAAIACNYDQEPTEVRVWDPRTGALVRTIATGPLRAVYFDRTGLAAVGVRGLAVVMYDLDRGQERVLDELPAAGVSGIAVDPAGDRLAAISNDRSRSGPTTVAVWSLSERQPLHRFEALDAGAAPAVSGAAKAIAYGGAWLHAKTFAGDDLINAPARDELPYDPELSPDGRWLLLGEHMLDLRDAGGPQLGRKPPLAAPIAFSADGRWFAGMAGKQLALLDLHEQRRRLRLAPFRELGFQQLFVSRDGQRVFAHARDGAFLEWNTQTGELVERGTIEATQCMLASPGGDQFLVDAIEHVFVIAADGAITDVDVKASATGAYKTVWWGEDRLVTVTEVTNTGHWLVATRSLSDPQRHAEIDLFPNDFLDGVYVVGARVLVSGKYRGTIVIDLNTLTVERTLPGTVIAHDPHGTNVYTRGVGPSLYVGDSGPCRRWSIATGDELSLPPDVGRPFLLTGSRWLLDLRGADVRVRDAATYELAATIALFAGTEAVITAPSGRFEGTPAGWSAVALRFSDELADVAPIDFFFADFFTPGLLGQVWTGAKLETPRRLTDVDRRPPLVELEVAEQDFEDNGPASVRIRVTEGAPGGGVRDIRLLRDGVLVKAWRGDHGASADVRAVIQVGTLGAGFVAYAFNRDNVKSRNAFDVAQPRDRGFHDQVTLLAIGIDRHQVPGNDLRHAADDARAFVSSLRRGLADSFAARLSDANTYERVNSVTLIDEQATKANILGELAALGGRGSGQLERSGPDSVVIVFFAGHGMHDGERFYLVPHDYGWAEDPAHASAISDLELAEAFENIDAFRLVFVIDACYSGAALDSEEARRGYLNVAGLAQLAFEKGMMVLSAAQSDETAREDWKLGHGMLTHALVVEGIEHGLADSDPHDGVIYLTEWLEYGARRVPELYAETAGGTRDVRRRSAPRAPQRPRVYIPPQARVEWFLRGPVAIGITAELPKDVSASATDTLAETPT